MIMHSVQCCPAACSAAWCCPVLPGACNGREVHGERVLTASSLHPCAPAALPARPTAAAAPLTCLPPCTACSFLYCLPACSVPLKLAGRPGARGAQEVGRGRGAAGSGAAARQPARPDAVSPFPCLLARADELS